MSYSQNMRDELQLKRQARQGKLDRVLTRPAANDPLAKAVREAKAEAVAARDAADKAAKR